MTQLSIKPFRSAREFVPATLDATKWSNLEPLYRSLIGRELHCGKCVERLLLDRSELDSAASEAGSVLYINMTCHTDDAATKAAYLDFVENVQPKLREFGFELDKKIAASPFAKELDQSRYKVLLRDTQLAVDLYRPENVPLETEQTKLEQKYSEISGGMTVTFRGEEKTLPMMGRYQEETDRATREEAWRAVAERRFKDREKIDDIFDQLVNLRVRTAKNAGFANFRDYMHRAKRRFDYAPEDCHSFAKGVEQHVVPALRRLNQQRREALGVPTLRPWDMAVDVKGRSPLRPFKDATEMVEKSARVFSRMDPTPGGLGELFAAIKSGFGGERCLDLETRKGKAPGGYQASRDRIRLPFIFMNAAGMQRDVETMVHEAGHAFHSLLSRDDDLVAYRSEIPLEFCEVASMSMELTTHPFLDEFYSPADADRARRVHLEQLATMLPWIATIDQFQQWVYTNPGHSRAQRDEHWVSLMQRFGPAVDYSGLEHILRSRWQWQLHLFGMPFYYIEYGIAQLGALQLWQQFRRDQNAAISNYKAALKLGGSRPLPDLFRAAGLDFDFSPARISRTWSEVESALATLPN